METMFLKALTIYTILAKLYYFSHHLCILIVILWFLLVILACFDDCRLLSPTNQQLIVQFLFRTCVSFKFIDYSWSFYTFSFLFYYKPVYTPVFSLILSPSCHMYCCLGTGYFQQDYWSSVGCSFVAHRMNWPRLDCQAFFMRTELLRPKLVRLPWPFFLKAAIVCTLSLLRNVLFILSDFVGSFLRKHIMKWYGALCLEDCSWL